MGCLVTPDHRAAVQHGLNRATAAFWANREFFTSVILWRQKMVEHVKTIRLVALYGSTTWTWSCEPSLALRAWECRMLRRMCRVGWRRAEGESFADWRRRHTQVGRHQQQSAGAEEISVAMLRRQFRRASGSLRRFSEDILGHTGPRDRPRRLYFGSSRAFETCHCHRHAQPADPHHAQRRPSPPQTMRIVGSSSKASCCS